MSHASRFEPSYAPIVDEDSRRQAAIAPGRKTLTSRLAPRSDAVQRRERAASAPAAAPTAEAPIADDHASFADADPLIAGIHFCDAPAAGPVQRKESAHAAKGGTLTPHQLATARRANPAWLRRLHFATAAFGGGDVGSADFAHAVAQIQAARGLSVDGIAGPATCAAVGAKPKPKAHAAHKHHPHAAHTHAGPKIEAAPIAIDPAQHIADDILGADAGTSAATQVEVPSDGHVHTQAVASIDAPKEVDEERATLDPSHDYHADPAPHASASAAAAAGPASHMHTQAAVTLDTRTEIDDERATLPIEPGHDAATQVATDDAAHARRRRKP